MDDARAHERNEAFVFGDVADDYERVRPGYPQELIDEIVAFTGSAGPRFLEIGAGTGKATLLLAERGLDVVALEPSAGMSAIASSLLAAYPAVSVEPVTFEAWGSPPGEFGAIVAAQAWHWVGGDKYRRAQELLRPNGVLAAFWNRAVWPDRQAEVREALEAVYRRLEPQLLDAPAAFPGFSPYGREQATADELEMSSCFGEPVRRAFGHSIEYSIGDYLALLGTQSMHQMLETPRREALISGLGEALGEFGDSVVVEIETRLVMARRA